MAIGSLTLTPEFNSDVTAYTTTTSNLSDVITATATDEDSTIVITNGETIVANGGSAIWSNGANTVSVVVTNGGKTKTYTVTVTKPVTAKLSNLTIGTQLFFSEVSILAAGVPVVEKPISPLKEPVAAQIGFTLRYFSSRTNFSNLL